MPHELFFFPVCIYPDFVQWLQAQCSNFIGFDLYSNAKGVHEENPLISLPLSVMLKQWAKDHWEMMGGRPRMTICINKVDIKEQVLACPTSCNRWTSVPNSDVYKASMMVSCELTAPNGAKMGKTDFTIRYEQYVPENYTLAQRKELWNQVYEGLINQLTIESNEHIPRLLTRASSR